MGLFFSHKQMFRGRACCPWFPSSMMLTQAPPLPHGSKIDAVAPDTVSEYKVERRESRSQNSYVCHFNMKSKVIPEVFLSYFHLGPEWIVRPPPLLAREAGKLGNRMVTMIWSGHVTTTDKRKKQGGRMWRLQQVLYLN